ncbi:LTA synthase family protein [Peribacillus sp. SCS-37]|uniref:LTA synthase family protein n=1 Tax=Paraperibacillus esterisolvens TaxID=3115296 RepID=UPI0039063D02
MYKTSFHIVTASFLQEFILFINPLGFLLVLFGAGTFFKQKRLRIYIVSAGFLLSIILYSNVVFYRFYNDFLTFPVLFQTSNLGDLGSSIEDLVSLADTAYFVDVILLWVIASRMPSRVDFEAYSWGRRSHLFILAAVITAVNVGLAETQRPQLLTRTFDREILVKNIGTFNYHLYDALLQTKSSAKRALADGSKLSRIQNYIEAGHSPAKNSHFGEARGKNLIMISMESLQSFVIGEKVNGREITPFLNEFIKESYYFDNFYHQTGQGKTSDAEFIIENSLYPLGRGAVFFTNPQNEYRATPEILGGLGYFTASMHANNKSFWNRDIMYKALGYSRYYSLPDYRVSPENSVGWGLKDQEFFEQSLRHMKEMRPPFYTKLITLTNHFPFILGEEDRKIEEFNSGSTTLNRYFPAVRYMDESIGKFIEGLKVNGLYDKSIIVLYGDHYGISDNHNEAMAQFLGREITPFESVQLQRVPMLIHIPGQKGETISSVSGQIDVKPTLLNLLGVEDSGDLSFGHDLLDGRKEPFTILRNGNFITKDYVYTQDACYSRKSGHPVPALGCEPYMKRAETELQYSDDIIYGDLLRFSTQK